MTYGPTEMWNVPKISKGHVFYPTSQISLGWNKWSNIIYASLVAQTVKRLPAMQETWVRFLGREDPLEKEMAIHSSILAWKIPWTEEPDRLQSMGSQRVGHDWATSLRAFRLNNELKCHFFHNNNSNQFIITQILKAEKEEAIKRYINQVLYVQSACSSIDKSERNTALYDKMLK